MRLPLYAPGWFRRHQKWRSFASWNGPYASRRILQPCVTEVTFSLEFNDIFISFHTFFGGGEKRYPKRQCCLAAQADIAMQQFNLACFAAPVQFPIAESNPRPSVRVVSRHPLGATAKHAQLHPFWKCHADNGTPLRRMVSSFTASCASNNLHMRRTRLIISA